MSPPLHVRVAHSPDADDYFLFWPLRAGLLTSPEFTFEWTTKDTEDLNQAARDEAYDVIAVSVGTLPALRSTHYLLRSGASVGRNYGPKLIVLGPLSEGAAERKKRLHMATIGVPGLSTTASLLLKHFLPEARQVPIPLTPYQAVFTSLRDGEVDAAVVIHEGQLAFGREGCSLVEDLGAYWFQTTALPIPVGVNVMHRRLAAHAHSLSALLSQSAALALSQQGEILPHLVEIDAEQGGKLRNPEEIARYLGMYANVDSLELPPDALEAIGLLLSTEDGVPFAMELI